MTREEAIKILDPETRLEYLVEIEYKAGFRGAGAVADAMKEALDMAIAALREQEERSKCEWCAKWKSATCPMSGRRLEEV